MNNGAKVIGWKMSTLCENTFFQDGLTYWKFPCPKEKPNGRSEFRTSPSRVLRFAVAPHRGWATECVANEILKNIDLEHVHYKDAPPGGYST